MIERIYDERYYSYAPLLKEQINKHLHLFLKGVFAFLEDHYALDPKMTAFIRHEDYYKQKTENVNFIIDLDSQSLLQVYGEFNRDTNTINHVGLKAVLPSNQTWNTKELERLALTESDGSRLKNKHSRFCNLITTYDLAIEFDGIAPPDKTWGYARITGTITVPHTSSLKFFNSGEGVRFAESYYRYIQSVHSFFERKYR